MQSFSNLYNCTLNIAGITNIKFIPLSAVEAYNSFELYDKTIVEITGEWYDMPITLLDAQRQFFEENGALSAQGVIQDFKLEVPILQYSYPVKLQLAEMEHQRFLVQIENVATAEKTLFGTPETPLRFTSRYSSARGIAVSEFYGKYISKSVLKL